MKIALYPGTFDPITYGHLDVLARACEIFDRVIVLVATNTAKTPLFSAAERLEMVKHAIRPMNNARVDRFDGLLVGYAKKVDAIAIVRGLRAVSDFEYELQMALMNRKLAGDVSTVFLMPHEKYTYLNSSIVRELASVGGDVRQLVPPFVGKKLAAKLGVKKRRR